MTRLVHRRLRRHEAVFSVQAAAEGWGCRSEHPWVTGIAGFRGQADYRFTCELGHRSGLLTVTSRDYSVTLSTRARLGSGSNLQVVQVAGGVAVERKRVVVKTTSDPLLRVSLVAPWTDSGLETLARLLDEEVALAALPGERSSIVATGRAGYLPELSPPGEWETIRDTETAEPHVLDEPYSAGRIVGPDVIPTEGLELSLAEDATWDAEIGIPVHPQGMDYLYALKVEALDDSAQGVYSTLHITSARSLYKRRLSTPRL